MRNLILVLSILFAFAVNAANVVWDCLQIDYDISNIGAVRVLDLL